MKRLSLVLVCLVVFSGLCLAGESSLVAFKMGKIDESLGVWELVMGQGALDAGVGVVERDGRSGLEMFYSHPEQSGFDYIDYNYIPNSPLNLLLKTIRVGIELPNDPDQYFELYLYDSAGGTCSFTFPQGKDQEEIFTLRNWDFQVWTAGFLFNQVVLVRFRSIGDAGTRATAGSYVLYELSVLD